MLSSVSKVRLLRFHDLGCKALWLHGTEVLQGRGWQKSPCHDDTCVDQATRKCQYTLYSAGIRRHRQTACFKYLRLPSVSAVHLLQVSKQEQVLKGGFKEEKSNSFIDPAGFFAKGSSDGFSLGAAEMLEGKTIQLWASAQAVPSLRASRGGDMAKWVTNTLFHGACCKV